MSYINISRVVLSHIGGACLGDNKSLDPLEAEGLKVQALGLKIPASAVQGATLLLNTVYTEFDSVAERRLFESTTVLLNCRS